MRKFKAGAFSILLELIARAEKGVRGFARPSGVTRGARSGWQGRQNYVMRHLGSILAFVFVIEWL
jgi:hypothetical protein